VQESSSYSIEGDARIVLIPMMVLVVVEAKQC